MGEVKPKCPKCGASGPALEWRDLYLHTGEHLEEVFCLLCGETLGTRVAVERKDEDVSKIGNCKKCGKKRVSLPARGLCSVCYREARKEEDFAKAASEPSPLPADPKPIRVICQESPYETDDYESLLEDAANELLDAIAEDQVAVVVDRPAEDFPAMLDATLADLRKFLIAKNRAYGNSALEPVRVFSKADPVEQLRVRIDDKLSRLLRGADCGEDTEMDLLGYLTLLQVARRWPCTSVATGARKA